MEAAKLMIFGIFVFLLIFITFAIGRNISPRIQVHLRQVWQNLLKLFWFFLNIKILHYLILLLTKCETSTEMSPLKKKYLQLLIFQKLYRSFKLLDAFQKIVQDQEFREVNFRLK